MDHAWAAKELQDFVNKIRSVKISVGILHETGRNDGRIEGEIIRTRRCLPEMEMNGQIAW